MSMLRVFKCTIPSCSVILGNGKPCIFVSGVYRTDIPAEIGFFENEILLKHPHLYIDPAESEIDSELVDPMNALRAKIIKEYLAAQEKVAGDPNRDMGSTDQNMKLNVGTTKDIAEAAAGGSGSGLAARLVNLTASKQ